ncbi:hypothetical protein JQR85_06450 [Stutzerimonas urumqiensis]|uniref:Rnf-Nqr domain containing protein n=1 Tax=Stutzerimonas urumqiensis TaxID=638269 RepID=UPI003DA4E0D1
MTSRVHLLALAPLLACTDLLITALAIGGAGLFVIGGCGALLQPLRRFLAARTLTLAALFIGGTLASCAEIALQALSHELYRMTSPFVPLLLLPCLALAADGSHGIGTGPRAGALFLLLATLLGAVRETLGHGSLFAHAQWVLGGSFDGWTGFDGLPLLTETAGALMVLGLLLAALRYRSRDDSP